MIRISLMMMFLPLFVNAQKTDYSGLWVLKDRKSIAGVDYWNALPHRLTVKYEGSDIYLGVFNYTPRRDTSFEEKINIKGIVTKNYTSSKRHKTVFVKWSSDNKILTIISKYSAIGDPDEEDYTRTSEWKLGDEPNTMIITNKYNRNKNRWDNYIIQGKYIRTSPSQLFQDTAKGQGIVIVKNLTWPQVMKKAKAENKFIFVDIYATWCGPCKKMEKEVFILNKIANFMNDKFINIKLQLDTTKNDSKEIRRLYSTANYFKEKYALRGVPTYLFFSPDGKLIHRQVGFQNSEQFFTEAESAIDSNRQYVSLLEKYHKGRYMDYSIMAYLARTAKRFGDISTANLVAKDYISHYLNVQSDSVLCLKDNIEFIVNFISLTNTNDRFFQLFYNEPERIDLILGNKGFAERVCNWLITKTEVEDKYYLDNNRVKQEKPDWSQILLAIKMNYPVSDAERLISDAQFSYFMRAKDWPSLAKCLVNRVEQYGLQILPDMSFDHVITTALTLHSNDLQILNKAIGWMDTKFEKFDEMTRCNFYGGYGVLLYKAGKPQQGIKYFEKHIEVRQGNIAKLEILEKMRKGEVVDENWKESAID